VKIIKIGKVGYVCFNKSKGKFRVFSNKPDNGGLFYGDFYETELQLLPKKHTKLRMEEEILEAVARGWCYPENGHKVMDSDLAEAIAKEVLKVLRKKYTHSQKYLEKKYLEREARDVFESGFTTIYSKPEKVEKIECKHKWQIVYAGGRITYLDNYNTGGISSDFVAICTKCFEKKYI
jgi:hypothetical protein